MQSTAKAGVDLDGSQLPPIPGLRGWGAATGRSEGPLCGETWVKVQR